MKIKILSEAIEQSALTINNLLKILDDQKDKAWVFFDTETSHLNPDNSQITEIAAIAVDANFIEGKSAIIGQFHQKCKLTPETEKQRTQPGIAGDKSVEEILQMNQYFTDNGAQTVPEDEALKNFVAFLNGINSKKEVILLAHNAKFDRKFVSVRSKKYNITDINFKTFDTLELIQTFYYPLLLVADTEGIIQKLSPKGKVSFTLGGIAKAFNIENKNWHSALADVNMLISVTKEVLIRLNKERGLDVRSGYNTAMKKWKDRFKKKKPLKESPGVEPDIFWYHDGLTDYEEQVLYKHANKIFMQYEKSNKNMLNDPKNVCDWWHKTLDSEGVKNSIRNGVYWSENGPIAHTWLAVGNGIFDPTALKIGSRIITANYRGH